MPTTEEQLAELDSDIVSGVLRERYEDKELWYRSLTDMLRARLLLLKKMGAAPATRHLVAHRRGLHE